jgi:hypothetical protein
VADTVKITKFKIIIYEVTGVPNLQETIARIKVATSHLAGLIISIMGCIVNFGSYLFFFPFTGE